MQPVQTTVRFSRANGRLLSASAASRPGTEIQTQRPAGRDGHPSHRYNSDLNIPWRHEVRIEDRLEPEARKTYPVCTGGDGACPPEDCGGPESFMDRRDDRFSFDALEDLDTMVEVLQQVALKDGSEVLALDQETRWRLEDAVERAKAREQAQGRPFSRREVNASLRDGEHHNLMHQQW